MKKNLISLVVLVSIIAASIPSQNLHAGTRRRKRVVPQPVVVQPLAIPKRPKKQIAMIPALTETPKLEIKENLLKSLLKQHKNLIATFGVAGVATLLSTIYGKIRYNNPNPLLALGQLADFTADKILEPIE